MIAQVISKSLTPLVLLSGLCCFGGCAGTIDAPPPMDVARGDYRKVELNYELDAGRMSVPLALTRVEAQLVSHEQVASNPLPKRSTGKLIVRYPHPAGREGYAMAAVIIESDVQRAPPSKTPGGIWWRWFAGSNRAKPADTPMLEKGIHETWVVDLPKAELDALVAELADPAPWGRRNESVDAARMTLTLDGKRYRLRGSDIPSLEQLMRDIRGRGQLVSYTRPAGPASPGGGMPSSLVAYRGGGASRFDSPSGEILLATRRGVSAPDPPRATQIARLPRVAR